MLTLGPFPPRISFSWLYRVRNVSHSRTPLKQAPLVRKTASGPSSTSFVGFDLERPIFLPRQPQAFTSAESIRAPKSPIHPKPSLFAELFPKEAQKKAASKTPTGETNLKVPTLPLPTVEELLEGFDGSTVNDSSHPRETTKAASSDAYKHRKIAVLVLQVASRSLIESDFRRLAPKGKHIGGWTGPGDILKGTSSAGSRPGYTLGLT